MKEFAAQTGGRYTYVDDVLNLQSLALAFAAIFDGCDNFIVNGCKVTGSSISDGYVYINGKLRYFPGATNCTWPQYIYESNSTESVAYESGMDKVGRNIYACAIANKVPTVLDTLTGEIPQYISISAVGGRQMKDALFGKYALILDSAAGTQEVKGTVNFNGNVNIKGAITTNGRAIVQSGSAIGQIYYENNNLVVQSRVGTGTTYKLVLSNDDGFLFYVNSTVVFSANGQSIELKKQLTGTSGKLGNIKTTGNHLYNEGVSGDSGSLYINYYGYNGGSEYYRNTYIGNGKSSSVLTINGKNSLVTLNGQMTVSSADQIGVTLKSSYGRTNNALQKIISWTDTNSAQIGYVGYNSASDRIFEIYNGLANVSIKGLAAVDLGPAIMENGVLLSNKYAQKVTVETELSKLAKSSDVYTTTNADKTFARLSNGLSQFVTGTTTRTILRSHINAVSLSEVLEKTPELSNYLSDMATSEEAKRKICNNIGAAYGADFQPKMKDSGWIKVLDNLFIRQIGNIVSIQGTLNTIHSGTVFTIPNTIDPPTYAVNFSTVVSSGSNHWSCRINARNRNCTVGYCSNHGATIPFSITYMV